MKEEPYLSPLAILERVVAHSVGQQAVMLTLFVFKQPELL